MCGYFKAAVSSSRWNVARLYLIYGFILFSVRYKCPDGNESKSDVTIILQCFLETNKFWAILVTQV